MTHDELNSWLSIRKFPKARLAYLNGVTWRTVHRWCTGQSPIPVDLQLPDLPPLPPAPWELRKVWVADQGRYRWRRERPPRGSYWKAREK